MKIPYRRGTFVAAMAVVTGLALFQNCGVPHVSPVGPARDHSSVSPGDDASTTVPSAPEAIHTPTAYAGDSPATVFLPISAGNVVLFTEKKLPVDSGQLKISAGSPKIISGLKISNPGGPCVVVTASDVVLHDNEIGPCGGEAVLVTGGVRNVEISGNFITHANFGILVVGAAGGIVIRNNRMLNLGDPADKNSVPHAVQFDHVTGRGHTVRENVIIGEPGRSRMTDTINIYMSSGEADAPINVASNVIASPAGEFESSSAGIILGDGCDDSGTNGQGCQHDPALIRSYSRYQTATDNVILNTNHFGVSVAGGKFMTAEGNRVYSEASGFPMTVYDFHAYQCKNGVGVLKDTNCAPASCDHVRIANNRSNYRYNNTPDLREIYYPPYGEDLRLYPELINSCGAIDGLSTNVWNEAEVTFKDFKY